MEFDLSDAQRKRHEEVLAGVRGSCVEIRNAEAY
jgi:hypothetical protein